MMSPEEKVSCIAHELVQWHIVEMASEDKTDEKPPTKATGHVKMSVLHN